MNFFLAIGLTLLILCPQINSAQTQQILYPHEWESPKFPRAAESGPPVERSASNGAYPQAYDTGKQPSEPEHESDSDSCAGDPECYQRRDLNAQEDMAIWAYWMTVATWVHVGIAVVGTVIALIGTGLVLYSLCLLRDQVKEAARTNDLAREFFVGGQRAWLAVQMPKAASFLMWHESGGVLTLRFCLKNTGKTPAVATWFEAELVLDDMSLAVAKFNIFTEQKDLPHAPEMGFTVFPNDIVTLERALNINKTVVDQQEKMFPDQSVRIYIAGRVSYSIIGDETLHRTVFIFGIGHTDDVAAIGPSFGDTPPEFLRIGRAIFGPDIVAD